MLLEEIQDLLGRIKGCTFASLDAVTIPKLADGMANAMYNRVTKVTTGNRVLLFTNKKSSGYENMVRRRLREAGKDPETFKAGDLPWGERIPDSPLIYHRGGHYLQTVLLHPGQDTFFLDGAWIAKSLIIGLREPDYPNQGLSPDKQVHVRTYLLDNIKAIRLMGHKVETREILSLKY